MSSFTAGMSLLLLAGVANAGFAIPLRFSRSWKWEHTWLVYSLIALVLLPWALAAWSVTGFWSLLSSLSFRDLLPAILFGSLWGVAQTSFGVAIRMLGIAVALPVISALGIVLGAVLPALVQHPQDLAGSLGVTLAGSCLFLVIGLAIYSRALSRRDAGSRATTSRRGILLCIFTGLTAGAINIGFALSHGIVERAASLGNTPLAATYPVWALILAAGCVPNVAYCGYLILSKRTVAEFRSWATRDCLLALTMAVVWVTATFSYGYATSFLGKLGTTIGYLMYGAFTILFANAIGWLAGEWKNVEAAVVRTLWAGMTVMLVSVGLLVFSSLG